MWLTDTLFLYKQPEKDFSLKSCLNFLRFLRSKLLEKPLILGKFDQKTVEQSISNTIFKQQVISEPQKLLHFSMAWALVAYKLVACEKNKCNAILCEYVFMSCLLYTSDAADE